LLKGCFLFNSTKIFIPHALPKALPFSPIYLGQSNPLKFRISDGPCQHSLKEGIEESERKRNNRGQGPKCRQAIKPKRGRKNKASKKVREKETMGGKDQNAGKQSTRKKSAAWR
jgi:hypothetical protein